MKETDNNATFYYFKPSGKWKYKERGRVPERFNTHQYEFDRKDLLIDGKSPGLAGSGFDLFMVVDPDDGWPRMYRPEKVEESESIHSPIPGDFDRCPNCGNTLFREGKDRITCARCGRMLLERVTHAGEEVWKAADMVSRTKNWLR